MGGFSQDQYRSSELSSMRDGQETMVNIQDISNFINTNRYKPLYLAAPIVFCLST
jgi:hypothetical protein